MRCSCAWSPAASATPTSTRPPASTRRATRPTVLGHEGAGVVEKLGPGVDSLSVGDHVVTLFSPQCRECEHCRSGRTNLCLAIREQQNKGYLPDGTTRLSRDGEPIRHFMGTSTFAEYTVMPEIALAKVRKDAPLEAACLFACGLSTGLGAAMFTAGVRRGLDLCGVRRRAWSASAPSPAAGCRAPSGSSASTSQRTGSQMAAAQGATDIVAGRAGHRRADPGGDRAASAPTTPSRRPAASTSCSRRPRPRAWAGACARSRASPARARRST